MNGLRRIVLSSVLLGSVLGTSAFSALADEEIKSLIDRLLAVPEVEH